MTEIAGFAAFDDRVDPRPQLDRLDRSTVVGAQAVRIWRDASAGLAAAQHRVTPEDFHERQPTVDPTGAALVFDGYLFDRGDLTRDFGFARELPDSRMAAEWLALRGAASLAGLRGDYALGSWNRHKQQLLLAVSPLAGRLLYYHARDGAVWFASTLARLLRFPGVPRKLNAQQLALVSVSQAIDPSATFYDGIKLLVPGTMAIFSASGMQETALWRPDPTRRLRLRRDSDYEDAGRELFERAVAVRLRAVGGTAVMMTGGLDSAAIATSAALQGAGADVHAYTIVPPPDLAVPVQPGWYPDERAGVAAITAMYPSIRPNFCHSTACAGFETDPTAFFNASALSVHQLSHLGWFDAMYRQAVADGRKVLLSGTAGNFTLSFDGLRGLGDLFREGRWGLLAALLPQLAKAQGRSVAALVKATILFPMLPPQWRDKWWRFRHGKVAWMQLGAMRPDYAKRIDLEGTLWRAGLDGMFVHQRDSRALLSHFMHTRRTRIVETTTAIRAFYGIEERAPLADADLFDFCLAIPREQFLLGGQTRSLMRRIFADRLPAAVLAETRPGQQNPEWHTRLSGQRAEFAAELDRMAKSPLAADMFDLPRLRALLDEWPSDAQAATARHYEFYSMLPRAVHAGRFIRFVEGGNG